MEAQQDILWIFNFLYLWIVLFLVWQPLVGANEVEESRENSQEQKEP
jgi:hypothetical protein